MARGVASGFTTRCVPDPVDLQRGGREGVGTRPWRRVAELHRRLRARRRSARHRPRRNASPYVAADPRRSGRPGNAFRRRAGLHDLIQSKSRCRHCSLGVSPMGPSLSGSFMTCSTTACGSPMHRCRIMRVTESANAGSGECGRFRCQGPGRGDSSPPGPAAFACSRAEGLPVPRPIWGRRSECPGIQNRPETPAVRRFPRRVPAVHP